ncbi:cobalamin biosynthesis protein [Aeromicrobium sp.]|uniref:cobalamin biosynthesis protein n=1 Tax=Aeromicrobium sp. TaxID=1871063 RepID=UPI003D6A6F52
MRERATGLVAGFVADRLVGDPAHGHPVAAFGRFAHDVEQRIWTDDRVTGAAHTTVLVGGTAAAGAVVARVVRGRPWLETVATAVVTWAVLGGRSLGQEARAVHDHLAADDLPAARRRLTHLVGRDTAALDEGQVSRAVVESVAENTSDAVVAPLLAGAVAGIPGMVAYRAANTLDAMVGHRDDRYQKFGWASARLDDLFNLVPARLSALLAAVLAPLVGGETRRAVEVWRRDAPHHPSPNAGPVEAAFAGALDVQLGGVNTYRDRIEDRHTLGDGRPVETADIGRSVRLADLVGATALVVAAVIAVRRPTPPRPRLQPPEGR